MEGKRDCSRTLISVVEVFYLVYLSPVYANTAMIPQILQRERTHLFLDVT